MSRCTDYTIFPLQKFRRVAKKKISIVNEYKLHRKIVWFFEVHKKEDRMETQHMGVILLSYYAMKADGDFSKYGKIKHLIEKNSVEIRLFSALKSNS